jgi:hypothetical protein
MNQAHMAATLTINTPTRALNCAQHLSTSDAG